MTKIMSERKQVVGDAAVQGSDAWLELRKGYRTASEAAVVLGISPFQKPEDMKLVKAGLKEVYYSDAMRLGNELEPLAREKAEAHFGEPFEPQIWTNGKYLASLDGISFDGKMIIEIKVSKKTFEEVSDGIVPEHYKAQMRQQMYCSGAIAAHLVVLHPETHEIAVSDDIGNPDIQDFIAGLDAAWDEFDAMPIPELKADIDMEGDPVWEMHSDKLKYLMEEKALLDEEIAKAKEALIERANGSNAHGNGVKIYHTEGRKSVSYAKAIKDLAPDADLSKYTTTGKPSWAVKVS